MKVLVFSKKIIVGAILFSMSAGSAFAIGCVGPTGLCPNNMNCNATQAATWGQCVRNVSVKIQDSKNLGAPAVKSAKEVRSNISK